ncbi:MAG: TRAP transporter substrate-binding protein DctP [Hyphomicrobiales bacterium]
MKIVKTIAACGFAMAVATGLASAQEFTLKYGHVGPATDNSDDHVPGVFLKSYLESRSNGRIKVEIYPAGQLGGFTEMMEAIQLGTLELTHTSLGGIVPFVPELQVLDIPYMLTDDRLAETVLSGPFIDDMRKAVLDKTGSIRLMAGSNTGRWRSFYTTKTQIKNRDDLAGVKIRTIPSPLQQEFVKFLGGNPTPVAWGELYTALGSGVVDGTKNAALDIVSNKLNEHVKYAVLDEHAYLAGFYWMNQGFLEKLPDDLRALVIDGVIQMAEVQTNFNKQQDGIAQQQFIDAGGAVYVPSTDDKKSFEAGKEHMITWYSDQYGTDWLDRLNAAIASANEEISASHSVAK